ncbi:hypothetical protein PflCFBP13510_01665 [Pseudomonas fluorescens]|nr:hypothetical protein PflCFBP13510_01665 [Pseudomonas fluorescens]
MRIGFQKLSVASGTCFFLLYVSSNLMADCSFPTGNSKSVISINLPKTIVLPRDTPLGTTVFESATYPHNSNSLMRCSGQTPFGVTNNLGSNPTTTDLFPIGDTGLSWQYVYNRVTVKGYGYTITNLPPTGSTSSLANSTGALRIVKTSKIVSGATIPAGDMGGLTFGGLLTSSIRLTSIATVTSPACQTPSVQVDMGQHRLDDMPKDGSPSKKNIAFNINLYNCPPGINKVLYTLTPTSSSPSSNSSLGIIKLNQTSTAKGIGLQIVDSDLKPAALNTPITLNDYSETGVSFTIPLNARYTRIASGSKISPGTANAEIIFVMSYL